MLNLNGIGVNNSVIDDGEALLFQFSGHLCSSLAYWVTMGNNMDGDDWLVGEAIVEAWGDGDYVSWYCVG